SPLLAWHALAACARAGTDCPLTHLEQDLLNAARDNAEAWALVSARRYERGDLVGALQAMQGAARAPTATYHWTDTIALAELALANHTNTPYNERVGYAISAAVISLPPVGAALRVCRAGSATSPDWAQTCLAF